MEIKQEIPVPDNATSSGTQVAAVESIDTGRDVFKASNVAVAVQGLAAMHTKEMGGNLFAPVISAWTFQTNNELEQLRSDIQIKDGKIDGLKDKCHLLQTNIAVLEEKYASERSNRNIRNLCITFGTALTGYGISLIDKQVDKLSVGLIVFGTLFLLFGWFSSPKREKQ